MNKVSRRKAIVATSILTACVVVENRFAWPAEADDRFDLTKLSEGGEVLSGEWRIEDIPGATRNGRALVQRAVNNEFNLILAPGGPYTNFEASVRFKPIAGREDASAGIVFRFSEGRYYVIRANSLEDNFRLYYYDGGRFMLTTTTVMAPMLGEWHTLRVAAENDTLRGWLNGRALLNHRDARFSGGRIGLWTKADSITAFDSLSIVPKAGG
jgi:hypothetical protein